MIVVHLDIGILYGNYVFSPFASIESFYKYVEESKKEWVEEIEEEGMWVTLTYPCIRKTRQISQGEDIIFCEEGWDRIANLVKNLDLADYCGILYKNERGYWEY